MSKVIEHNGWQTLRRFTPARIALGRAGHSLPTQELLQFGLAHAQARDAVHLELDVDAVRAGLEGLGMQTLTVHSAASDRAQYLLRPDLGRRLAPASRAALAGLRMQPAPQLCVVIGDGLSACAVHRHAVPLLQCLLPLLAADGWTLAPAIIAQQSRVALADEAGELLQARVAAILIGERPGLSSPDSLGVYMTYDPRLGRVDAERNCISNIRPQGLAYRDAAHKLLFLLNAARRLRLSGVQLKDESDSVQTLGDERDRSGG